MHICLLSFVMQSKMALASSLRSLYANSSKWSAKRRAVHSTGFSNLPRRQQISRYFFPLSNRIWGFAGNGNSYLFYPKQVNDMVA